MTALTAITPTLMPPTAGTQAGASSGGGFLDSVKSLFGGSSSSQATTQEPKSVGLFDGVLKSALWGGATSAAATAIFSFIPGTPIVAGVFGAVTGAAMGVFGNWMKMQQLKQQNEAFVAGLGVQPQTQEMADALRGGDLNDIAVQMQVESGLTPTGYTPQTPTLIDPTVAATQAGAATVVTPSTSTETAPATLASPATVATPLDASGNPLAPGETAPPDPYEAAAAVAAASAMNPATSTQTVPVPGGGVMMAPAPVIDASTLVNPESPVPLQGAAALAPAMSTGTPPLVSAPPA